MTKDFLIPGTGKMEAKGYPFTGPKIAPPFPGSPFHYELKFKVRKPEVKNNIN